MERAMEILRDPKHYMPGKPALDAIRAQIDAYNSERPGIFVHAQHRAWIFLGVFGVAAAIAVVIVLENFRESRAIGVLVAAILIVGYRLWEYAWKPARDHQMALRHRLFPVIFGFLDNFSYSHGRAPAFLDDVRQMKLIRYGSSENDDIISGTHQGLAFDLLETTLVTGSGKRREVVFRGLIFRFNLDWEFPGLIVVAKRGNWLQRYVAEMFRTGAKPILSGNRRLDETHEFHSDNPKAAMPVITGPLTSALIWLGDEWRDGEVRIAIRGRECILLLPSKRDWFALPDIQEDVFYGRDVEPMIREMVVLLAVAHLMHRIGKTS